MIVSVRRWLSRLVFAAIFACLTAIVYEGFQLAQVWIRPLDPYAVPRGQALKVFEQPYEVPPEGGSIMDRLRWFYYNGE
ncbi:YqzK family protein [Paenibacillus pasadenensis]|uniref:DUF4227 family protein n=1 Tax=Paenibacillus pasadenensis TaxID=217090 RepID=UPI00203E74AA|nr:DUF4227 family protein [Paenibacillus pasadenensis]MCM3747336.1 YqzK family protein [Paenibacillus pasadenensis]